MLDSTAVKFIFGFLTIVMATMILLGLVAG